MDTSVVDNATPMDNNVTYDSLPDVTPEVTPVETTEPEVSITPVQENLEEAIHISNNINADANAGTSMNKFLTQDYDYDKNEAGSYWVAGAINDNNTQMSFLNTLINEEMYDDMDLQKYYYDTTMASARAYAAEKSKETAYGFYRAAQEKAIAEGQLTGWYMPAEGQYLLGQYNVAQLKLDDPNATEADKAKASRVTKTAEEWFKANQISTRGIKCLGMMNYEENVRHNDIMGKLKKQAGDIQRAGIAASAAGQDLQLREYKFRLEEMELQQGYDITKDIGLDTDSYIGHNVNKDYKNYQALRGYKTADELLTKDDRAYGNVLGFRGREWVNETLRQAGKDPDVAYNKYQTNVEQKLIKDSLDKNGKVSSKLMEDKFKKSGIQISSSEKIKDIGNDRSVYVIKDIEDGEYVSKCYYKTETGTFKQLNSDDIKLRKNKKLSKLVPNFSNKPIEYNGEYISIGDIIDRSTFKNSVTKNKESFKNLNHTKEISNWESKGYHLVDGYYSTKGINAGVVMKNDKGEYIEISDVTGEHHEISKKHLKEIKIPKDTFSDTGTEYFRQRSQIIGTMSEKIPHAIAKGLTNDTVEVQYYSFTDANGNTIYYKDKPDASGRTGFMFEKISEKEANKKFKNLKESKIDKENLIDGYKPADKKPEAPSTSLDLGHVSSGSSAPDLTYNAQDTVDKRAAVFKHYDIPPEDIKKYNNISNLKELELELSKKYKNLLIKTN